MDFNPFLEGDAFMIKSKGRPSKQLTVHRFQVYEGVEISGHRHRLLNRHVISSLSHSEALKELKAYLDQHYDLSQTKLITGSDNGSGYQPSVFDDIAGMAQSHQHMLDRYHLNRKIRTRLSLMSKALVNGLIKAIDHGHFDQLPAYLDTAESLALDHETQEDVRQLRAYLKRNWDSIRPLGDSKFAKVIHSLGSCEINHRRYTYRLKHQGRSWTKAGLSAMLRVIDAQQNGNLPATLITRPEFAKPLSPTIPRLIPSLLRANHEIHQGIRHGSITADTSYSSPVGHLAAVFNNSI
ncbi:ISLre2 family transposase [Lactiplantibacillus pentosus]|uniref:ISLre2 family transposase n=1 Tax=Lactiplantibacillus pentosus TaxID=1589 RepID=UPI00345C5E16